MNSSGFNYCILCIVCPIFIEMIMAYGENGGKWEEEGNGRNGGKYGKHWTMDMNILGIVQMQRKGICVTV
jgi:hypothetical protein